MAKFTPEEWTQNKDLIWAGYVNKNMTHAMLAQFWDNDEATAEEAAAYVLRACQSYKSMLAFLKKAYLIIEEEAERRESFPAYDDEEANYWTEMRELANEIKAEIEKAKGKTDPELCPHGYGFVEYCEDCNQKEIKAKWREKEDSHG